MEMFDKYDNIGDYIPNNMWRCKPREKLTLMAGETTIHSFEIPFNVDETMEDFDIIYKLGLHLVFHPINKAECEMIQDKWGRTIITCTLIPEQTLLFADTLLKASVQIKFLTKDGKTSYTEIYPIKLLDALDVDDK